MVRNILLTLILALFILTSCSETIEFEEGIFVEMRLGLASEEFYLDHYPRKIAVHDNGTVRLFTEDKKSSSGHFDIYVGENPPEIVTNISDEEVEEIKQTITKNKFFSLDDDLTDYDVMDGSSIHMIVFAKDKAKQVGGENPNNEKFSNIYDVIFQYVSDDYYDWDSEVREYIYEANGESLD